MVDEFCTLGLQYWTMLSVSNQWGVFSFFGMADGYGPGDEMLTGRPIMEEP